jgi:crossover junction endodeoxyribonuclease RuvC
MNIVAFDPAIAALGFAWLWTNPEDSADVELREYGTFETPAKTSEGSRLLAIRRWVEVFLEVRQPGVVVLERPAFHGQLAANSLPLGMAYGVLKVACEVAGVPVIEYAPNTIKKAVTGDGRAKKAMVRKAVKERFGGGLKGRDDGFDAVATGLTHIRQLADAEQEGRETRCRLLI